MFGVAGSVALLLGTAGVFGVISYAVSQRSREIAIRVAVGAKNSRVTAIFLRRALLLAIAGAVSGLVVAAALSRLMRVLLFGISPIDWLTYASAAALVLIACALAAYLAARRALAVDPMQVFRG